MPYRKVSEKHIWSNVEMTHLKHRLRQAKLLVPPPSRIQPYLHNSRIGHSVVSRTGCGDIYPPSVWRSCSSQKAWATMSKYGQVWASCVFKNRNLPLRHKWLGHPSRETRRFHFNLFLAIRRGPSTVRRCSPQASSGQVNPALHTFSWASLGIFTWNFIGLIDSLYLIRLLRQAQDKKLTTGRLKQIARNDSTQHPHIKGFKVG